MRIFLHRSLRLSLFFLLSCGICCRAEDDCVIFGRVISVIEQMKEDGHTTVLPSDVAQHFIGMPYVAGTADKVPEALAVNLHGTDCILFAEMCLAFCIVSGMDNPSFDDYCRCVRTLRYRDGKVDGYASRLHYTSEWIAQAESGGFIEEMTEKIGGSPHPQAFSYMSSHTESYPQLSVKTELEKVKNTEQTLSGRMYNTVPKSVVSSLQSGICDGDLIFFVTSVEGLDISHVGIALWRDGELTFIHASSSAGKVIVNEKPLADYANGLRGCDGIRVARIIR